MLMMMRSLRNGKAMPSQCLFKHNHNHPPNRPHLREVDLGFPAFVSPNWGECPVRGDQQWGPDLFPELQRAAELEAGQGVWVLLGAGPNSFYMSWFFFKSSMMFLQETMTHTTLQRIFSVLNCKLRMEKIMGTLSNLVLLNNMRQITKTRLAPEFKFMYFLTMGIIK